MFWCYTTLVTKQERIIAAVIISLTSVMIISSIITVCIVSICVNQNNKPELLISDIKIVNDIDSIHEINSELNSSLPLEILINNGNDLSEYQSPRITWKIVGDNLDCSITTTGLFTSGNVIETVKVTVVLDQKTHRLISAKYSSINPNITGSTTLTVRKWMETLPFDLQYEEGIKILKSLGVVL